MDAESRDTVNRSTYIIATLDESFNLYTVLIRDITRYVEVLRLFPRVSDANRQQKEAQICLQN